MLVALSVGLLAQVALSEAASAQESSGRVESVASCVAAAEDVRVLFLLDESGSLRFTDPDDERITAARFALESFLDLSLEKDVEARVAGFSADFTDSTGEWVPLNDTNASRLEAEIDAFADRQSGLDTDLPNALGGAYDTLDPVDPATCNLVLLFADGGYDIAARTTPQLKADLGTTKNYAPGIEIVDAEAVAEARVLGREALCDDEDGTMAQLDDAGVRFVTIALAESDFITTDLLESLTVGRAPGQVCGKDLTGNRGVFTSVSSDELSLSFGAITGRVAGADVARSSIAVCAEGEECLGALPIAVDQLIDRFEVAAQFSDPSQELIITHPNGDDRARLSFEREGEIIISGAVAKATWIDEKSVTVAVIPTGSNELSEGEWTVAAQSTSPDSEPARLLVTRFPNLESAVVENENFTAGEPGLVSARVSTLEGRPITGVNVAARAVVTDTAGKTLEVNLQDSGADDGIYTGTVDVPIDFVGPAAIDVEIVATTIDGLEFTDAAEGIVVVDTLRSEEVNTDSTPLSTQLMRLGVLGLIFLAALAVWLFLWRRNEASDSRFELDGLSVASIPVVVRGDGALFRVDGQTRPLAMSPADFNSHPDPTPSRVINLPQASLRVVPAKHPFDERSAEATAQVPVTGKYGTSELTSTTIDANLRGSWLFLLDGPNSLEANADSANPAYGSVAGELLVFLHTRTNVQRFFQELPEQLVPSARALFRLHRNAAAERPDGNTADMLEWVDQWAGSNSPEQPAQ